MQLITLTRDSYCLASCPDVSKHMNPLPWSSAQRNQPCTGRIVCVSEISRVLEELRTVEISTEAKYRHLSEGLLPPRLSQQQKRRGNLVVSKKKIIKKKKANSQNHKANTVRNNNSTPARAIEEPRIMI